MILMCFLINMCISELVTIDNDNLIDSLFGDTFYWPELISVTTKLNYVCHISVKCYTHTHTHISVSPLCS